MYDGNIMDTARTIRTLRSEARLTQAALADRIGTDQAAISRWERGHDEPRLATLQRIATACGRRVELSIVDDDVDRAQLRQNLDLTPSERLAAATNLGRFTGRARRR